MEQFDYEDGFDSFIFMCVYMFGWVWFLFAGGFWVYEDDGLCMGCDHRGFHMIYY